MWYGTDERAVHINIFPMSQPELRDPNNPRTRKYLHAAVHSLPQGGASFIKIVKQATRGIRDKRGVLGVLPASFNPPTSAHEALVSKAGKVVALDESLLVLDQRAMDKERIDAPLEDRLLMLLVLFGDDPRISLGIANQGLFLDKVEALHHIYPRDTKLYFIVGYDTIVRVLDPIYYKERNDALHTLFSQARFLVANRGDRDERDLKEFFGREENRPFSAKITSLTLSPALVRISSSEVRSRLAVGKSVQGFVPPKLEEFLLKRGFYSRHDP
jgi:nicotinic acid mononucleotide adenylyltransferase